MKRLHLLILRSFFGPFLLIFFIVLFVLLMQFLWRYIDELIGKGLEFSVIAEFLLYTSATLVPMALPLSILMSSLMTFGNLGEKYELTAIKASGISLQKIMRPLVIVVFFVSIGTFFFANNVLPFANLKMRSLLYDIRQQRPELQLNPGQFNNLIDGYSIRINDKDPKTNTMYDIQIYDHTDGKGNVSVVFADSGTMQMTLDEQNLLMTLYHGHSYNELQDLKVPEKKRSYPHRYDEFEKQEFLIGMSGFNFERTDQDLFKNHYAMMNLNQLIIMSDSIQKEITFKEKNVFRSLTKANLFKKRTTDYSSKNNSKPKTTNKQLTGKPLIRKIDRPEVIEAEKKNKKENKLKGIKPIDSARAKNKDLSVQKNTPPATFINVDSTNKQLTGKPLIKETDRPELIKAEKKNKKENKLKGVNPIDSAIAKNNDLSVQKNTPPVILINIDSVFNQLTLREKSRATSNAVSFARTAKNLVVNSLQVIDAKTHTLRRYEIEWHRKFTIAFACLVFLFIGAPLGAIIRKGGLGLPLVLSVLFFILYYILSLTGEKLVRESIVIAYQGMWATSAIFTIAGGFLTYQATTDSSMLNMDTYLNFLKKYFGQRYNIVDTVNLDNDREVEVHAKLEKISASLFSLEESVDEALASIKDKLRMIDIIGSIFTPQNDSVFVLFDRYYNNTFRIIINHPIFHKKTVRAKIYEFPSYKHEELGDRKWVMIVRTILACTIVLTPLVLLRQYLKVLLVRLKFRKIKLLLPELSSIINRYESDSFN